MERIHRDRIQVNYLRLSKEMRDRIVEVVKYLRQKKLISDTMEEDIVYQRTPSEKAYKLLDTIQTRGPKAFGILYDAVLEIELWTAADILEPSKAPHESSQMTESSTSVTPVQPAEEDEPLPDNWPTESHLRNVEDMKLKVKKVEEHQTQMKKRFQEPNEIEMYPLKYKSKGRVLIIDNEKFTHGLEERTGSSQDTKGLRCVFQAMDFDVWVESNKTKKEMDKIINDECLRKFNDVGCFILIMLSHGARGKVFGTDGKAPKDGSPVTEYENYIEIADIKQRFSRVETLKGKPKMFIIQACQNGFMGSYSLLVQPFFIIPKQFAWCGEAKPSENKSMVLESSADNVNNVNQQENSSPDVFDALKVKQNSPQKPATVSCQGGENMVVELNSDSVIQQQTLVKRPVDEPDKGDGKDPNLNKGNLATDAGDADIANSAHEGSDMLTALATIEGHPSYRNTAFGSWFIQAFIYVLANYAYKHELSNLMKKVTQLVMKARSRNDENQVCERRLTMGRDFYFFPGLSSDMS